MPANSRRSRGDGAPEALAVAELAPRLVYSLLKAAVRIAAHAKMPMAELLDLTQLAYFEQLRKEHPRELAVVADKLGLSLRSTGSLSRRLKQAFFAAEAQVQPARKISSALLSGPQSVTELHNRLPELERSQVKRALAFLKTSGWVEQSGSRYTLRERLRSYVDETLSRRIDGLNNQMEILAASVWARFVEGRDSAVGRSWVFAARSEDVRQFAEKAIRTLRHGAIDLEEAALSSGEFERYGMTVAIAEVGEDQ